VKTAAVAALSSAPKDAGGDTGATGKAVTIICKPQVLRARPLKRLGRRKLSILAQPQEIPVQKTLRFGRNTPKTTN